MNKYLFKSLFGVLAAVLIAAPCVADPLYLNNETAIKGYLVPNVVVDEEGSTVEKSLGNDLSKKAVADSIVLLKNENDALPLSKTSDTRINILGYWSINWLHGGSGSGMVSPNPSDTGMTDLVSSLKGYGIEINQDILNYYRSVHVPAANPDIVTLDFNRSDSPHSFDLYDPSIEGNPTYQSLLNEAKSFSNTAFVVLGRQGGESEDMPEIQYKSGNREDTTRHDLQLSAEEEELLTYAGANFEKVVVIVNSTNAFQMDFLERIQGIDAAVWIGPTGTQGALGIPDILYGNGVSPSGHLADILPYDFTSNINYNYCGYEGVSFFSDNDLPYGINQSTNAGLTHRPSLPYVDYVEGIYLGYRYYETADAMGKFDGMSRTLLNGNKVNGYEAVVQFPFGFGLSYTSFKWTVSNISLPDGSALTEDSKIDIEVLVENIGERPGKDVVELYAETPYLAGGIEKSAVKLVDFAKTENLEPGKSQALTLHAKARDLASYDCYDKNGNNHATYELDKGSYSLKLCTDSHTVKNVDFVSGSLSGSNKPGKIGYHVDSTIVLEKDPNTGKEIKNLFTGPNAIDGKSVDGLDVEGWNIPYVSRDNLPNAAIPQSSTHDNSTGRKMDSETRDLVLFAGYNGKDNTKFYEWVDAEKDEFGNPLSLDQDFEWSNSSAQLKVFESDGLTLTPEARAMGNDFNHENWNQMLGQLSHPMARNFVNNAHPSTRALDAIGYPAQTCLDGPAQTGSFKANEEYTGVGFPPASTLACSWNKNLLFEIGLGLGKEMNDHGLYGIYGCGMNIHRNPFGGRNYEYFSEDPFLTGSLAANYALGVKLTGHIAVCKHFVAAETETSRDSLYTYMSEQTLREIYLEPFRMAVEGEGLSEAASKYVENEGTYEPLLNSLMTSYNRIGATWAGGSVALLKGVLRNEWGFKGEIITDWSDNDQYMHLDQSVLAGGALGMDVTLAFPYDSSNRRAMLALREAIKETIYCNIRAKLSYEAYQQNPYEGVSINAKRTYPGFDWVTPVFITFNVLTILGAASAIYFGVMGHPGLKIKKKEQ